MARLEIGFAPHHDNPQEQGQLPQAIPFGKTESSPFHASVNQDERRQNLRRFFEDPDSGSNSGSPKIASPTSWRDELSPKHIPLSPAEEDVPFGKTFSRTSNFSHDSEAVEFGKRRSIQSVLTDYGDDLPYINPEASRANLSPNGLSPAESGVLTGCQAAVTLQKGNSPRFESFVAPSGARASTIPPDGDRSFPIPPPSSSSHMLPVKIESSMDPSSPVHPSPTSAWSGSGTLSSSSPSNLTREVFERERRDQERLLADKRERELLVQSQRDREQAFMQQLQRERQELCVKQQERELQEQQGQLEQLEREKLFWQHQQQLLPEQFPGLNCYPFQPDHAQGMPSPVHATTETLQACRSRNGFQTSPALPPGPSWPGPRRGSEPIFPNYGAPGFDAMAPPHQCFQKLEKQPMPSHMPAQISQQPLFEKQPMPSHMPAKLSQQLQLQQERHYRLEKKQQEQRQQRQPQQKPQQGHSRQRKPEEPGPKLASAQPSQHGQARSTVMFRNLPVGFTRDMLTDLLSSYGFVRCYDFIYMPINFRTQSTFGYAFVNFCTERHAQKSHDVFGGFRDWCMESDRVCEVTWSDMHQGLAAHVDRYRNSPVMHESVPDEYKPVMFANGVRVLFPPPTKKIRVPRIRRASEDGTADDEMW